MKKFKTLIIAFVTLAFVITACGSVTETVTESPTEETTSTPEEEATSEPITEETMAPKSEILVGNLQDESGPMKALSIACTYAATMQVEKINAAGGINGHPIKLITYDTRSDVNEAINAYHRLVEQDKVVAVFGPPIANIGIALAPVAEELKVPVVGLFMDDKCTIQENGEPWHYMYLVQNSAPVQGKIIAQFAIQDLKAKTAAILYNSQNSYSVGMAIPFEEVFTSGGGQIVAKETYTSTDKDFRPQLTKIKAANPDVIYFPSYPVEIPLIYTQAYELGITVPMLGSNSVLPTGLAPQTDPAATANTYFPYGINPTEPDSLAFAQEYKAKFGIEPVAQAFSGYDAFGVLVQAISACGEEITSECINQELNNVKDYQGFQGSITISPTTHQPVPLPMAIMTIKDGKAEFVKWYTPEGPLE